MWEKAGGYINQNYKFMVDGELWTRFFLYADLYSVDCILGGYRFHSNNRGESNMQLCKQEMEMAISKMKAKCPKDIISINNKLKWLRMVNRYLLCKNKSFSKLVSIILKDARYKNIYFKDEVWRERVLPFNLR